MKIRTCMLACLVSMLFVLTAQAQTPTGQDAGEDVGAPAIEPEALEAFKDMADYLAAAKEFAYEAESGYDVVQDSGVKVEFGGSRKVLVSRPNRLRIDSQRRDGVRGTLIFDGDNIWAHVPDENVYATAEQPGDLDEAIGFAVAELSIKAPLAELLSPDLYKDVSAELTSALYLGETVVAGVTCEHLLMSNDYADLQMWITSGEHPVLRRIVITYREEPGEPQYRTQFLKWEMSPKEAKGQLEFKPPEGAERIRFYSPAMETDLDLEDAS